MGESLLVVLGLDSLTELLVVGMAPTHTQSEHVGPVETTHPVGNGRGWGSVGVELE